jgi:hypothetical protein
MMNGLPDAARPDYIHILPRDNARFRLPATRHGKLDLGALNCLAKHPDVLSYDHGQIYLSDANDDETMLRDTVQSFLSVEVDLSQHFVHLGGTSLQAFWLAQLLSKRLNKPADT